MVATAMIRAPPATVRAATSFTGFGNEKNCLSRGAGAAPVEPATGLSCGLAMGARAIETSVGGNRDGRDDIPYQDGGDISVTAMPDRDAKRCGTRVAPISCAGDRASAAAERLVCAAA